MKKKMWEIMKMMVEGHERRRQQKEPVNEPTLLQKKVAADIVTPLEEKMGATIEAFWKTKPKTAGDLTIEQLRALNDLQYSPALKAYDRRYRHAWEWEAGKKFNKQKEHNMSDAGECHADCSGDVSEAEKKFYKQNAKMRKFETGATRDTDTDKLDYAGFLSPIVLKKYAEFMHKHRVQADGKLRASDNWKKGIPRDEYMRSAYRHFMDWWGMHEVGYGDDTVPGDHHEMIVDAICGLLFNTMGYLHEKEKQGYKIEP